MSNKHYDIAIIGGSLTARISAALLAKNGSKVLFLRNQEAKAPAWFHSSIFLEKLLGILGARSCFVSPEPFQILSEKSRITVGNDIPLEKELQREFGPDSTSVNRWLTNLLNRGNQLEELLWENGGVPWASIKSAASFKLLCLRRKVNFAQLETPVRSWLNDLPENGRAFIRDLLQGLSLTSIDHLSYARAALLWAQALRPENLQEPDFSLMLNKRFDQFRGAKDSLDELVSLDFTGKVWTGGTFRSGGSFTAKTFLLGDKNAMSRFSKDKNFALANSYVPSARETSDLSGQLSTLLASRVICGGELPLRIAIEDIDQQKTGLVLSSPDANEAAIRQQLQPALPFADYSFDDSGPAGTKHTDAQVASLSSLPIQIKGNLFLADRAALLPEMGGAGAALLAWTIFQNIGNKAKQEK